MVRGSIVSAVVAFCAIDSFLNNVVGFTLCCGKSMEPTIDRRGEVVVIDRLSRMFGWFERGDVVIARSPYDPNMLVCKRIVGSEGDLVPPTRADADAVSSDMTSYQARSTKRVAVPRGHVWLQGDNLPASRDSREYGPVPLALLTGRAVCAVRW